MTSSLKGYIDELPRTLDRNTKIPIANHTGRRRLLSESLTMGRHFGTFAQGALQIRRVPDYYIFLSMNFLSERRYRR